MANNNSISSNDRNSSHHQEGGVSRLDETSYLSPYSRGEDSYSNQRKNVLKLMESRGLWKETIIEESIGLYHLDIFGHVSGPSLSMFIHGSLDRAGSFTFERFLGIKDAQGLCTGRGPITVLPRKAIQDFRIPITWPDTILIGARPITIDEDIGALGEEFEVYSLKTGLLCYKHTVIQSLIDVTKGGRSVNPNKLAINDARWKEWKIWWNTEADKSKQMLKEVQSKQVKIRSEEVEKRKDLIKNRQAKI